jgi:hypothetical protein
MKKAAIFIIIAGLLAVLSAQHVSGICMTPGPPCQEFWRASAVFAGRVISVTEDKWSWPSILPKEPPKPPDQHTAVHAVFEVSEPFRGVSASKIEVRSPKIRSEHSIDFRVGQEYIVYAYRDQLRPYLYTSACTRTSRIENATEDLAYARSVATRTATGARIFGKVFRSTYSRPASGIQISLWLGEKISKTKTNPEGDFEFTGMSVGDYQVLLPSGAQFPASVLDIRGCACLGTIPEKLDR